MDPGSVWRSFFNFSSLCPRHAVLYTSSQNDRVSLGCGLGDNAKSCELTPEGLKLVR